MTALLLAVGCTYLLWLLRTFYVHMKLGNEVERRIDANDPRPMDGMPLSLVRSWANGPEVDNERIMLLRKVARQELVARGFDA